MRGDNDFLKLVVQALPGQGGALWLFLLIAFMLWGDTKRLFSRRNLLLLLLAAPALPLVDIMRWEQYLGDPDRGWLLGAAFSLLFATTAFMGAWSLALALGKRSAPASPRLTRAHLRLLFGFVLALNVLVVLARFPEDAGPYSSLGAKRWLETGKLPYGDPLMRGPDAPGYGAPATYGPLLMAAHIPFQYLLHTTWNDADVPPKDKAYARPPLLATKLCCLAFHLLGLLALIGIGNRLRGPPTGLALATLYAASPYVIGMGGQEALICGLPFISHIAPPAVLLLALYFLKRPVVAGALVAVAAGVLFYPAFFFPAFLGWYVWRKRGALAFTLGFAITGLVIAGIVIHFTGSIGDQGPIKLFLESTLEHQEGSVAHEYGTSKFSFWGTHPDIASFWQQPLTGSTSLLKPTFLLFAALCGAAFLLARRRSEAQLALLVAMLSAGIQLWKTHAAGTYVEWYFPFLLIGLFASPTNDRGVPPGGHADGGTLHGGDPDTLRAAHSGS